MSTPNTHITGYSISRHYTCLTIWHFDRKTKARISRSTVTPRAGLGRRERYDVIVEALHEELLPIPEFKI